MESALLIPLITQVGLPLATEIVKLVESKTTVSSADLTGLVAKYGTMTADQYLAAAKAALNTAA